MSNDGVSRNSRRRDANTRRRKRNEDLLETIGLLLVTLLAAFMMGSVIYITGTAAAMAATQEVIADGPIMPEESVIADGPFMPDEAAEEEGPFMPDSEEQQPKFHYLSCKVTAYCPCEICCDEYADGITKTGTIAMSGRTIAVDPDEIPIGSTVYIDGHQYIAEDIGGQIQGKRIDLYFDSHEEALEWGVQYKIVKVQTA